MEKTLLRIVIPWDFTPVAENALKYAITTCKSRENYRIDLVHVVSSGGIFAKDKLSKKEVLSFEFSMGQHLFYSQTVVLFDSVHHFCVRRIWPVFFTGNGF